MIKPYFYIECYSNKKGIVHYRPVTSRYMNNVRSTPRLSHCERQKPNAPRANCRIDIKSNTDNASVITTRTSYYPLLIHPLCTIKS
jgi:hypothetical protein